MKSFIKQLLRRAGWLVLHDSTDPLIRQIDATRNTLRMTPAGGAAWTRQLASIAFGALLRDLLQLHQPDLAIDVGANRGQFAEELRTLGFEGPILSIEPQAALVEDLCARARQSTFPWVVEHGGASDNDGVLELKVYVDNTFSSFHTANADAVRRFGGLLRQTATEKVPVRRLDNWLAKSPFAGASRILFKTDTQGHDLAVLAGAPEILARSMIFIGEGSLTHLYDSGASPDAYAQLLAPFGLKSAGEFPIAHDADTLVAIEVDCIFTRPIPTAPSVYLSAAD